MYVVDSSVAVLLISMSILIQLNYFHSPVECTVQDAAEDKGVVKEQTWKKKERKELVSLKQIESNSNIQ